MPLESQSLKIWLGLCKASGEAQLEVSEERSVPFALLFGEALLPFSEALAG